MLCGEGNSTNIMYHALKDDYDIVKVVIESSPSKKTLLKNRMKRLGVLKVIGQVLFMLFNKLLSKFSRPRVEEIKQQYGLNESAIASNNVTRVESVNSEKVTALLLEIQPDAVVVNGTRIIQEKVLNAVEAPFINTHVGITPKYRGVHGGYWALANGDRAHCGVTVHLVDKGIDTGGILYQEQIDPTPKDSFNTYPLLQLAKAIPWMKKALNDARKKELKVRTNTLPSKLWYHPTLFTYLFNYVTKGIK